VSVNKIQFNKPYLTGRELSYIAKAHEGSMLAGDGPFTGHCHKWLEENTGCGRALLTHSCTAALEMSALLLNIQPGDEIIMPSFTFVSTANAFVLRGGVLVFVDIRSDTLNLDESLIESAITPRTKAIVPVHYAGVACEMDAIVDIANRHQVNIVEDAAQGVMSTYKGRALGSIGDLGCFSFHETKNVISGEGGAILVNNPEMASRAELIREKGTDRSRFFRGEVDKYTWQEMGSSYLPGELIAAFLWAQLEEAESITAGRMESWKYYDDALTDLENEGKLRRPVVPIDRQHNAHMYYVLLDKKVIRKSILTDLLLDGVDCVSHYVPLHSSPAGLRFGRVHGSMDVTNGQAKCLIRLPLWSDISLEQQDRVVEVLGQVVSKHLLTG
jgi:dTDP-4-amino-4,6-dideoxygalactose transaminase